MAALKMRLKKGLKTGLKTELKIELEDGEVDTKDNARMPVTTG